MSNGEHPLEKTHIWDQWRGWEEPHDWSIEYDSRYELYSVYAFGVWGKNSLLEGQIKKVFKDNFYTEEQATKVYPQAPVGYIDPNNTFNHLPDYEMTAREEEKYFDPREDY